MPGYLAGLASRTLGIAPVLRPATPSRFEPEGPQAELREIAEVREAEPGPAAPPQGAQARAHETAASAFPPADRPPRGFFAADIAGERGPAQLAQEGWAASGVSEPAGEPAEPAERSRRSVPPPAGAGTEAFPPADRPLRGFFAADIAGERGPAQLAQEGWAASGLSEPAGEPAATGVQVPADAAVLTPDAAGPGRAGPGPTAEAMLPRGSRVPWPEHMVQAGRSRQQAQAPGRAGEADEARGAEPAIVVRIGRVDVRAVQAAPPPAPAPRPQPAAGPSLAEHLLARDRRRR